VVRVLRLVHADRHPQATACVSAARHLHRAAT
jgi:hypothetical protein